MAGFMRQLMGKGILEGATMNQPQPQQQPYQSNNSPWNLQAQQLQQQQGKSTGMGQPSGPFGAAMKGMASPAQGMFSQNNMGQGQATPQAPMGMGGNPLMNMMNPYQGPMQGAGNPNQRQPFMGGIMNMLGRR